MVYSKDLKLVAIRFGGYPESVQGMADVIAAGCNLDVSLSMKNQLPLSSRAQGEYVKRLTHDGVYAECLMYLEDDRLQSLSLNEEAGDEKVKSVNPNRNLYIFCQDEEKLFQELDQRLSVPLIPAFQDYFLKELISREKLQRLNILSTSTVQFEAWLINVSNEESEIAEILTDGLKHGDIAIPGASKQGDQLLQSIETFTSYLREFKTEIAERIKESFIPVFDPAKDVICDALDDCNQFVIDHAGYSLFDAQLGAAEAIRRQLESDRLALLIAECGTGKSKIGAAALYAYQRKKEKAFNVVLCPSHLTKKWVRELDETIPNCIAAVVSNMYEVDRLHELFLHGDKTVYCVISKETARNGFMRYPAVIYSKVKQGYICPDCGTVQEMSIIVGAGKVTIPADQFFFQRETAENHKCQNPDCGHVLWSCLNPDTVSTDSEWVRIGGYGYVSRRHAVRHLSRCKDKKIYKKIEEIVYHPNGLFPVVGAYRRTPLSAYIKTKVKHIDGLISDELHEYSGESAQGEAMADLAGIADKVIGLTATLINGYSKGLFYLLYRMKPYLMSLDNQQFKKPHDFCAQYGVIESVYKMDETYNAASKSHGRKVRERQLPGVSPLVYPRYLLENCVFLSLADMGKELPDYEEIPVPCRMSDKIADEYKELESSFKHIMREDRRNGKKLLSAYVNLLTAYPDQPYGQSPIIHPETRQPLIEPRDLGSFDIAQPKDKKVIELIEQKVKGGERVIVYTAWTRLDTREKLRKLLTDKGYRVKILDKNIPTNKREEWVDKQVAKGIDVLIVNPTLVETGLDLNAFTTLIFYNIAYNLFIFRQAARRSYRINQTAPKISVYMFYYTDTMQQRALRLMATKLAAATVIEGNLSEEGLAAMADCSDMMTELAKELMSGLKDAGTVEDLAASYKKMSINNGHVEAARAAKEAQQANPSPSSPEVPILPIPIPEPTTVDSSYQQDSGLSFTAAAELKKKPRKAPETYAETGQLDLFSLLDDAS